jgi:hypothetical protein
MMRFNHPGISTSRRMTLGSFINLRPKKRGKAHSSYRAFDCLGGLTAIALFSETQGNDDQGGSYNRGGPLRIETYSPEVKFKLIHGTALHSKVQSCPLGVIYLARDSSLEQGCQ